MSGRPRSDLDEHKDLIIELYHKKTPWHKIEQTLLAERGCRAKTRTIMRRFKEWNVNFHRIATDKNEHLKAKIQEYWADRDTRPKNDEELYQRLTTDGFIVTPTAISRLRRDMNLFRRWDERLGRVRPDSELLRKRRAQKHSASNTAQLDPLHGHSRYASLGTAQEQGGGAHLDFEEPEQPEQPERPEPPEQPEPPQQSQQPEQPEQLLAVPMPRPDLAANNVPKKRGRPRKQPVPIAPAIPSTRGPRRINEQPLTKLYAKKNVQLREAQERIRILEQHCLASGIGLPGDPPEAANAHGLQSQTAGVAMQDSGNSLGS